MFPKSFNFPVEVKYNFVDIHVLQQSSYLTFLLLISLSALLFALEASKIFNKFHSL